MIDQVFKIIINDNLTPYFNLKMSPIPDGGWIIPCNASEIVDPEFSIISGKLTMSLVNIEEERTMNNNRIVSRQNQPAGQLQNPNYTLGKPPVYLNLYILFAYNSAVQGTDDPNGTAYITGLQMISYLVQFFQFQNVFNAQTSPNLAAAGIHEVIFDLKTLSFQDLNNLWGVLGSKYLPSVLYKVRMLTISEDFSRGNVSIIKDISINDIVSQQS